MKGREDLTTRDFWDCAWRRFDAELLSEKHYYYGRNGLFLRSLRHGFSNFDKQRVIELGGAGSKCLLALAKFCGAEVTSIDYSPVGADKTRKLFEVNRCAVSVIEEDFLAWIPVGEPFDVVVHWGLLEHFRDPQVVLRLCAELLRPGGTLIFTMPNLAAYGAVLWRRWSPNDWSMHVYHSDEAIATACVNVGLRMARVYHWGRPLLQVSAPWEKSGVFPSLVAYVQRALTAIDALVPIYDRGFRRISAQRCFVAEKR